MDKQFAYQQRSLTPTSIWLLFLYWNYGSMGKMGKQIFYLLTLGGIGFWIIYRFFTLNVAIRKYNKQIAYDCGVTNDEVIKLGLF